MNVELRQAIEAYGKGLEEVDRLVRDDDTLYGVPLGTEVVSAYAAGLAELLERSFAARDEVDEESLAACIGEMDASSHVSDLRGGASAFVGLLLSQLYIRGGRQAEPEFGVLTSPSGPEFVPWLHELLSRAGYSQDVLDSAWQRLLVPLVNAYKRLPAAEREEFRAFTAHHVGALIDAMPSNTCERIIDEELSVALEGIGIAFTEGIDIGYQDEDGQVQHIKMSREDYEREVNDAIAQTLMGRKPVSPDDSPLRHVVTLPPASLVLRYMSAPRELVDREGVVDGPVQARLSFHYLRSPDVRLRQAAWTAGQRAIQEARQVASDAVDYRNLLAEWGDVRPRLLAEEEGAFAAAARECEEILARAPAIIIRSLADVTDFGPEPAAQILRLVTPDVVADWLDVRSDDLQSAESIQAAARRGGPPSGSVPALVREAGVKLTSPFPDARITRERFADELDRFKSEDSMEFLARMLDTARDTSSASLAANIAALCMEVEGFREMIRRAGQVRDQVASLIAHVLVAVPQRTDDGENEADGLAGDLSLEYEIAGWLYYVWRNGPQDATQRPYEELAYLAIRGASLLLSLASTPQADEIARERDACRSLRAVVRSTPVQAAAWHMEPEDCDYRLHPVRGWTFPWASLALLSELAEHQEFFSSEIADAEVGQQLLNLAQLLAISERFSTTSQTKTSWLEDNLRDQPSLVAVDLLKASQGHVIDYWPQDRRDALEYVAGRTEGEDTEKAIVENIANADLGIATYLMAIGVVYGPIDNEAWMSRLSAVFSSPAIRERIASEVSLLHQGLRALRIAAVVTTRHGSQLPAELLRALLPEEDVAEDLRPYYVSAVTQALGAGARLDGAGEWLENALRATAEEREQARAYVEAILEVQRSRDALGQSRSQITEALRRISGLRPYVDMPELRRYRGPVSDERP